jgi:hypothetical protein
MKTETDFYKMFQIIKDAGFKGYVGIEYEGGLHENVRPVFRLRIRQRRHKGNKNTVGTSTKKTGLKRKKINTSINFYKNCKPQ